MTEGKFIILCKKNFFYSKPGKNVGHIMYTNAEEDTSVNARLVLYKKLLSFNSSVQFVCALTFYLLEILTFQV